MRTRIWNELAQVVGAQKLELYGWEPKQTWSQWQSVELGSYTKKQVAALLEIAQKHPEVKGVPSLISDCEFWLRALEGKTLKCRTVEIFESMFRIRAVNAIKENLKAGRPGVGPRLYKKDELRNVWLSYYVSSSEYYPAHRERGELIPARAEIRLHHLIFTDSIRIRIDLESEQCAGLSVEETLGSLGYLFETAELWEDYQRRCALFEQWHPLVGKQFFVSGFATDDVDGNERGRRDSWFYKKSHDIDMMVGGERSRAVIDVFFEEERESRGARGDIYIDRNWWHSKKALMPIPKKGEVRNTEDDTVEYDAEFGVTAETYNDLPPPLIPLHPMLAVFDLRRQKRLKVDVGQLEPYVYDSQLGDKLVLPPDSRSLVEMLLAHKEQFVDIVKGKSGGSIILCAGLPGTGKTLTSEVYAEVMARPLYTVQASQLGVEPETLEENLLMAFARATRWKAIMLIDEADVYVHTRGNDLTQNAIVGVFLRVLEYYSGVLFLTTNRADLVDDAIASRCVARIDFTAPSAADQKRIWQILSQTSGIKIAPEVIDAAVTHFPELTGRDVKNLLKLAQMVAVGRGCPITLDVLRFVKRFKPTGAVEKEPARVVNAAFNATDFRLPGD